MVGHPKIPARKNGLNTSFSKENSELLVGVFPFPANLESETVGCITGGPVATPFTSKRAQEHPKRPRNERDIVYSISPSFLGRFGCSWARFEANSVATGPPVIHPNDQQRTLFQEASWGDRPKIAQPLIKHGANA